MPAGPFTDVTAGIGKPPGQVPLARVRGNVLEYSLAQPSDATVKISDLAGRERFSHRDADAPAGMRFIPLPRQSLPQGLYVVDLVIGTTHQRFTFLSSGR